jgi:valyl-tRNA synthetase
VLTHEAPLVGRLTRSAVAMADTSPGGAVATVLLPGGSELIVPLGGIIDLTKEREKLSRELVELDKQLGALRGRLGNESFTARAPAALVEAERAKEREWTQRRDQLAQKVDAMGGAA